MPSGFKPSKRLSNFGALFALASFHSEPPPSVGIPFGALPATSKLPSGKKARSAMPSHTVLPSWGTQKRPRDQSESAPTGTAPDFTTDTTSGRRQILALPSAASGDLRPMYSAPSRNATP